jgi:uncharacterized protein YndB with AHSA1/START domain
MKTDSIIVERTFDAPIAKVWNAITNKDEMKKWYFDLEEFKPKAGFKFDFIGGDKDQAQYLHLCEVQEAEAETKLSYTWRYDNYPGNSLVTWELMDKGEKTILRLTHADVHTLAEGGPDFARENFVKGWTYIIHTSLRKYLEANDIEK